MKNFFIVTFWSLINKYISLLRVQLTQRLLGASGDSDAFHLAFRLIAFFRRIFTDGSFYSFFSSYFIKKDKQSGDSHNLSFALGVLIVFSSIFTFITLLFFLFPVFLTKLCIGGRGSADKILLVSQYAKYMFPMALSMFLCSLFSSILNAYNEFFHSSVGLVLGSITNVSILYFGCVYMNQNFFWPFVIGTLSYTFIHALYMGIVIYIKHYKPVTPYYDKSFFKKISVTGTMQVVNNILYIFMNGLFFAMKPGGYSYVEYSERLSMFVFMLVAHNLSQIITPVLSKLKDLPEEYTANCNKFFSMTMFLVILPTIFMFFYSHEIIKIVYTTNSRTNLTTLGIALKHVAISMPFWNVKRILLTFFECKKQLKQQNITGLIYNLSCCLFGAFFMRYKIFPEDYLCIIWSMNLAVIVEIIYLLYESRKTQIFTLNVRILWNLLLKLSISVLLVYITHYFITGNTLLFLIIKALLCFITFGLIFIKDTKTFFHKS